MSVSPISVIVFDLGGVLVDFTGIEALRDLTGGTADMDEIRHRWVMSKSISALDQGRIAPEPFARAMIEEWSLDMGVEEMIATFRDWVSAPYPGTEELLSTLARSHRLACLSNTNAIHWDKLSAYHDALTRHLEHAFLSFRMGLSKPHPEIFHAARETLAVPAGEILFLDDTLDNVDGARAAGWQAERVRGLARVREVLEARGLLGAALNR